MTSLSLLKGLKAQLKKDTIEKSVIAYIKAEFSILLLEANNRGESKVTVNTVYLSSNEEKINYFVKKLKQAGFAVKEDNKNLIVSW